ncbi:CorA metal ion transporter [Coemansia sp. IMI 203386]|nr:CorA metal ion transporter [Coemansia sp. IMI 203386]
MGPQDQNQQQQQPRRTYISESRRRAATGYLSGTNISGNDCNTVVPTLEQGGYGGFNGVVFGSGGSMGLGAGGQGDLGGVLGSRLGYDNGTSHDALGIYSHQGLHRLSEPPQATTALFGNHRQGHSAVMEQVSALYNENQMLRKQNQALLAASDARQQAVIRLLKETVGGDDEKQKDDDGTEADQKKKQLMQLLLVLLDAPSEQNAAEGCRDENISNGRQPQPTPSASAAPAAARSSSTNSNNVSSSAAASKRLSTNRNSNSPRLQSVDTENTVRQRSNSRSSGPVPLCETKASGSSSRQPDWDAGALQEISSQGCVADNELKIDKYAKESRKAIGTHQYSPLTRRKMSLSRRRSSLLSMSSDNSPEIITAQNTQQSMHPGAFPSNTRAAANTTVSSGNVSPHDKPFSVDRELSDRSPVYVYDQIAAQGDEKQMGPLAVSLLAPSDDRFDPDPKSRFVLYSASAGIFQAERLNELCSDEMTLADIIEASSKAISLDQLRSDRADPEHKTTEYLPHLAAGNGAGCFWIDVTNPTAEEMASLARVFGIHPLTVEDIMADEDGRDKFETFSGYSFLMYRTIDYGEDAQSTYEFNRGTEGIATASFSIVLKQSCVLTFHRARELEHVGNVVSRLRDLAPVDAVTGICAMPHIVTPAYIAYALVDDITDTLAPEMRSIELEIDAVDELVLILSTNEQADMLQRIGAARRKILTIWRLLQGKPEVIRSFSKLMERRAAFDDTVRAEMEDAEYLRRMMDAVNNNNGNTEPSTNNTAAMPGLASLRPSASSGVLVSPQTTLRRNTNSFTALAQMSPSSSAELSGTARRKDVPLWPTYITGAREHRVPSTRPSTADLSTSAVRVESEAPITADEVAHYLSDVYDHLVSLLGSSSHCDMVLSRAHSNYLARISLELGESTVETNLFASRWTVIGAILVPLNVVTGLWGMNVKVPGGDREDLRDFFLILSGCMAFVVAVIVWAKFKKIF